MGGGGRRRRRGVPRPHPHPACPQQPAAHLLWELGGRARLPCPRGRPLHALPHRLPQPLRQLGGGKAHGPVAAVGGAWDGGQGGGRVHSPAVQRWAGWCMRVRVAGGDSGAHAVPWHKVSCAAQKPTIIPHSPTCPPPPPCVETPARWGGQTAFMYIPRSPTCPPPPPCFRTPASWSGRRP
jgi:hypothetical protein